MKYSTTTTTSFSSVKKLMECVNSSMDINNILSQVDQPETVILIEYINNIYSPRINHISQELSNVPNPNPNRPVTSNINSKQQQPVSLTVDPNVLTVLEGNLSKETTNIPSIIQKSNDMEVIYNYQSTQNGVLSVKAGDIIRNVKDVYFNI